MSFRIEDLPTLDNSGRLGRGNSRSLADAYVDARPASVATQVASLGAAIGLGAVRALQNRFASAGAIAFGGSASPAYSTWPDCTIYSGYGGTCEEPCFGFEPHHMDSFYCATCDEQAADPVNNPAWHWHFAGTRGTIEYMDREPDVCNGRDAWKWTVGACRDCNESAVFRCHDGWKRYSDGTLAPTICEGLISCDNELTLCP